MSGNSPYRIIPYGESVVFDGYFGARTTGNGKFLTPTGSIVAGANGITLAGGTDAGFDLGQADWSKFNNNPSGGKYWTALVRFKRIAQVTNGTWFGRSLVASPWQAFALWDISSTQVQFQGQSGAFASGVQVTIQNGVWNTILLTQGQDPASPTNVGDRVFLNGSKTGANWNSNSFPATALNVGIGYDPGYSGRAINGSISDVIVWNRGFSDGECNILSRWTPGNAFAPAARRVFLGPAAGATFNPAWANAANSVVSSGARSG